MNDEDIKKLEALKAELDLKNGVCLDEDTLNYFDQRFSELQGRIFNGVRVFFEKKFDEKFNQIIEQNNQTIKMLEDKGYVLEEPKKKEIESYMDKIKELIG